MAICFHSSNQIIKINMKKISIIFLLVIVSACKKKPSTQKMEEINVELMIVADSISSLMSTYHYNPEQLGSNEYIGLEGKAKELALTSKTKEEFIEGYNQLWAEGPFSHVRLAIMQQPAEEMANYIDSLRVGGKGVNLEWMNNTAMLTVNTMMGVDTQEQVFDAYRKIAKKRTDTLIIDLRNNEGGTFAGIPLMGHLTSDTIDIGMFVSQKWWNNHAEDPTVEDVKDLPSWEGWSIRSFWKDVQDKPLTRVQIKPMSPQFQGPVYVLISNRTASAAEFTVDALAHLKNVTIIGQTTAGEMLSQKMFDLPHGLQLSLPIADYYATRMGRIEGKGVDPDIAIDAEKAKELSLALIKGVKLDDARNQMQ